MSLSRYKEKRNFSDTPEPVGKEKSSARELRFVIQKHDATNLHYDFRLELRGVLKSWAVPKGPSLNPVDKRLAMMVEDHPYDYRTFEGIIPAGNYGGGTVIVWDEGTYEPMGGEGKTRSEQEKMLLQQLHAGDMKLVLHGQKVQGTFGIFRLKKAGENSWLLVKKKDEFASEEDVTELNTSVTTNKTIAQVAAENGTEPNHPEEEKKASKSVKAAVVKSAAAKKTASKKTVKGASKKKAPDIEAITGAAFSLARKTSAPVDIKPMLATLVSEPFDNDDWLFEIKWDGYRALAYLSDEDVQMISRNNKPFEEKYFPIAEALRELQLQAVFDGEIVAINEKGLADFQRLQNWQNTPTQLQFYVFDILWFDGYDVTKLPLIERKKLLESIIPKDHQIIKYSDHVINGGNKFFEAALNQGLEGIMAKKLSSSYQVDSRAETWLKIKVNLRQEVVIAGFTQPRNTRKFFGALMLGVYKYGELVYVGHSGSGFDQKTLKTLFDKMQPLVIKECPFTDCPKGNMPVTWIKPSLVCEIKFTEWTKEGIARHPIFMGLRDDKKAGDVHMENSTNTNAMVKKTSPKKATIVGKDAPVKKSTTVENSAPRKTAAKKATTSPEVADPGEKTNVDLPGQLALGNGKDQELSLNGHLLKLTNLDKLYWKKEKRSKLDSINYYLAVAPYMLPYMLDRPQSLNRHPNGIDAPNFYQKDMKGKQMEWMKTHTDFSESTNQEVEYLVCSNAATLIYMANLGCIEMHPWHSRSATWQQPDWCLIDLDPDTTNTFDQVIEVAQVVHRFLDSLNAESFVKTSGSSGIHIYIPMGAKYSYDQSKQLAELIVNLVHQELPDITSVERNPAKRKGKIYLDFLQNRETQTAAAPYSLRPKPGMPVSTPLHWEEVKKGLTPTTYNMDNIFDRLKSEGDLFKGVMGKGINLDQVLKKIESLVS